jgi:hypothetical protein
MGTTESDFSICEDMTDSLTNGGQREGATTPGIESDYTPLPSLLTFS